MMALDQIIISHFCLRDTFVFFDSRSFGISQAIHATMDVQQFQDHIGYHLTMTNQGDKDSSEVKFQNVLEAKTDI